MLGLYKVMKRAAHLVAAVGVFLVIWLYLPPFATMMEPGIEPNRVEHLKDFLAPKVSHAAPAFSQFGEHVYYRVRLTQLVGPGFVAKLSPSCRLRASSSVRFLVRPIGSSISEATGGMSRWCESTPSHPTAWSTGRGPTQPVACL